MSIRLTALQQEALLHRLATPSVMIEDIQWLAVEHPKDNTFFETDLLELAIRQVTNIVKSKVLRATDFSHATRRTVLLDCIAGSTFVEQLHLAFALNQCTSNQLNARMRSLWNLTGKVELELGIKVTFPSN